MTNRIASLGMKAIFGIVLLLLFPAVQPAFAALAFIQYPVPTANSKPIEITSGPDGNLWFTEESGNNIGRITTTGAITEYAVPTPNSDPEFITAGPDGNLWFTEDNINVNNIGRITTTGAMIEYPGLTAIYGSRRTPPTRLGASVRRDQSSSILFQRAPATRLR